MKVIGLSDIGYHRNRNEDTFLIREKQGVFVVCDGMGGHKGGHIASNLAIEVIDKMISENEDINTDIINKAIDKANKKICKMGQADPECYEMGTTVTAVKVADNQIHISHVGDSRLYIIRENSIRQITKDHTLAEQMVANGIIDDEELHTSHYNHVLTRALGIDEEVEIDNYTEDVLPGDIILICSDGLSDMLKDIEILSVIYTLSDDIERTARELIKEALDRGGHDNITVVLIRI